MAVSASNKVPKKPSGSRVASLVILVLIIAAVAGYYMFSAFTKTVVTQPKPKQLQVKPAAPKISSSQTANTESPAVPQTPQSEHKKYPHSAPIPEPVETDGNITARLAIVIDDMGGSLSEARSLAAINVPLTFAIIPGLRFDKAVAAYAASKHIETMIHIPMQSKGWPSRRLEANGLLVEMDDDDLQERVSDFIQQFPGAVGVNNHMGSEFTEQEVKMEAVLKPLKNKDLFYIDSVTSPESTGLRVAQRMGIRTARRNVFLDNEQERGYILGQLNQAVRLARKNGSAIAICHPHPATISALAAALPGFAGKGVKLVPASQLVN